MLLQYIAIATLVEDSVSKMAKVICRKCGRVFEASLQSGAMCDECRADHMDKYHQVREYLWEHPNTPAATVAKDCGVSVHQVMIWVREERFEVSDESKIILYCANCGTRISTGKYCARCAVEAAKYAKKQDDELRLRRRAENMKGISMSRKSGEDGEMRYLGSNEHK